ncbi:MAG TPA: hypothetical protein VFI61_03160 [Patescibacteria group bacterium]|nr:hypothetical protein [Patescibacteria group bacterium]
MDYVRLKYTSTQIAIARIKNILRILPTPKYKRTEKRVRDREVISPRRVLANKSENINKKLANNKTKNKGSAPKVLGSTK